jgi:hypothetical protein
MLKVGVPGAKVKANPVGASPQQANKPVQTVLGTNPPGRPASNIGQYLVKPTADVDSGFEMINTDPNVLKRVHENYLKKGELPPALQPKYLRKPEVLDKSRANAISRGWRKPRSQQG